MFFLTFSIFGCSSKNPNRDILIAIHQQSQAIEENTKVMKEMITEKKEKKKVVKAKATKTDKTVGKSLKPEDLKEKKVVTTGKDNPQKKEKLKVLRPKTKKKVHYTPNLKVNSRITELEKQYKNLYKKVNQNESRITQQEKINKKQQDEIEELKRVQDKIAWAVAKSGGIKNVQGFKVGPFEHNSSKINKETKIQINQICKEYREEAEKEVGTFVDIEITAYQSTNEDKETSIKRAKAIKAAIDKELNGIYRRIKIIDGGKTTAGFTDRNARRAIVSHKIITLKVKDPE
jgi:hypothetical protein